MSGYVIPCLIDGLRGLGHAGSRLNRLEGRVSHSTGMLDGPFVGFHVKSRKIGKHHFGNLSVLWVLGFGALEERLEG